MTWKTSLLILFATVMVAFVPLSAYAGVDDGNLRKITSDGQYDIGMSWQPAGPLQPGIDYLFNFEIREGMSQKNIDDASFNFNIVKDGIVTDSTSSNSGTITKTISFENPGIFNLMLTDVNSSSHQIDFTMPVGTETTTKDGISYKNKIDVKPKIYFCGFEKNAKTLTDCLRTQTTSDYGWFGKVNVMIYAPGWNTDSDKRERIGATSDSAIKITSRVDGGKNGNLGICSSTAKSQEGFIETGSDTGVFYGRLKLSGHDHDLNGDGVKEKGPGGTKCKYSPFGEYAKIETGRVGAVTVNWEYNNNPSQTVSSTLTYNWNVGTIEFLKNQFHMNEIVEFKFYDKDMYKLPKDKVDLDFKVWSDSDMAGITVSTTQDTNWKFKNPYHFNIQDTTASYGDNLFVQEGDTIYVEYIDTTLPRNGPNGESWSKSDNIEIIATTSVTSGYPYITIR